MKKILCIFLLIFTIFPLFAEENTGKSGEKFNIWGSGKFFALDPLTDGILLGTGVLLTGGELLLDDVMEVNRRKYEEKSYSKSDVNAFDRKLIRPYSKIHGYNYFANEINLCVSQMEFKEDGDVKQMSLQNIAKEVRKAYQIVTDPYFASHNGAIKPMLSSFIYREFQITGVTFAPFAESNINTLNASGDIPFTVAHELAHTKGVMIEEDANKLAFYVCLNSENPYLRFSAYNRYFYLIRKLNSSLYMSAEERATLVTIDSAFDKYASFERKYWDEHDLLGNFADWVNNLYIKSSGDSNGTGSYYGGTTDVTDPELRKITSFSPVQKLFLEKYYRS